MPDCFISYSSADKDFATAVYHDLREHGLEVFMAAVSLIPGDRWSDRIHDALSKSKWVIFLASRAACTSPYVQQEVGRALDGSKRLIPVVWEMAPHELPGWVNQFQALDIRGLTPPQIREQVFGIAGRIREDKQQGAWIAAALITALIVVGVSAKPGGQGA